MHFFVRTVPRLLVGLLALQGPLVSAQNACSSDGASAPRVLVERFLSADCTDCWQGTRLAPGPSAAVLDWIVPTAAGDDAPLSAAARPEALLRLQALGRQPPATSAVNVSTAAARPPAGHLRVSFGPAVSGYVGADVSYLGDLPSREHGPWTVSIALVEQVGAGTEGTAVERNLVRNLFQRTWDEGNQLLKNERTGLPRGTRWIERRAMQLAPSTDPSRLAVIGWMEDRDGQVVATAVAQCLANPT